MGHSLMLYSEISGSIELVRVVQGVQVFGDL